MLRIQKRSLEVKVGQLFDCKALGATTYLYFRTVAFVGPKISP